VTVSASLGRGGVHGKPVFQVMQMDGRIVAYAKLGWNEATAKLVQEEASSLRRLEGAVFSTATVPRVLHAGWFRDHFVLVQAAVGGGTDVSPWEIDQRHLSFLRELAETSNATMSATPRIEGRLALIRRLGFHYYAYLLEHSVKYCEHHLRGVRVPQVSGHGDFAPWNIRVHGGKLLVLDWEYAQPVPVGFDLFHFLIGAAVELKRQSAVQIYRDVMEGSARRRLEEYFDALQMPRGWTESLLVSWIAETLSRNLVLFGDTPSEEDQASRRVWATLLDLIVNARRSE
jgi:aminoglycoside phosphotransferase (APT) family kinase protein